MERVPAGGVPTSSIGAARWHCISKKGVAMIAVEQNVFHSFLTKHDEKQWAEVMSRLMSSIHPVDQIATKIWFSFWPLRLAR